MTVSKALRIFLPFAFGYYLSFLYRSVNAIIAPGLIHDIGVNAASLGLLSSAYFIAFASSQIPLGIILDRMGSRKVGAGLLLFAALGAIIFSRSDTLFNLIVGRALIGFGVSACLMASFKAFVDWFPKERIALANGAVLTAGGLGALTATAPIELALQSTDWRGVFFVLAALTLLAAILIYFVIPERPLAKKQPGDETLRDQFGGLIGVIKNLLFLRYAPVSVTSQGLMLAIQGLWLGPWLTDVAGLSRSDMASSLFVMAIALTVGFLSWGIVGERFARIGVSAITVSTAGIVLFCGVQLMLIFELSSFVFPVMILFGIFGTAGSLALTGLAQNFPSHLAGRVYTTVNLLTFIVAFGGQWGIGIIINQWPQVGPGQFSPLGYQVAFGVALCAQLLCMLWIWVSKFIWPEK
jgi:predicted MFS family arabinose efflux permease